MKLPLGVLVLTAVLIPTSFGSVLTTVTSPGALSADDSIDWGQLGIDLTVVTPPAGVTSALLNTATLTGAGDFWSIQQGNTWGGNFSPNANVLYNTTPGAFVLTFANPIHGAGAHFQSATGGSFTATITAFGAGNTNFGTVSVAGNSTNAGDGSAVFLGVTSDLVDIVALQFNVQQARSDTDFAIDQLLISSAVDTSIPEPSTWVVSLLGLGLLGLRRKSA